jgi:hypothetical protein
MWLEKNREALLTKYRNCKRENVCTVLWLQVSGKQGGEWDPRWTHDGCKSSVTQSFHNTDPWFAQAVRKYARSRGAVDYEFVRGEDRRIRCRCKVCGSDAITNVQWPDDSVSNPDCSAVNRTCSYKQGLLPRMVFKEIDDCRIRRCSPKQAIERKELRSRFHRSRTTVSRLNGAGEEEIGSQVTNEPL